MWLMRVKQSLPRLLKLTLTISISMLLTCSVFANPVLDNIAAGQVSVQQTPNTTVVNQSSQQAILNWQSFNIGHGESTHFNQPVGGIALNRINPSQGASQIYGSLTSTGQIILMNPAGFFFGPGAYVNVGGLLATTGNVSDQNFLNGIYQFSKVNGYSGAIINEGQMIAAQNGLIALLAPGVINKGVIQANVGKIALGSGEAFTVNFSGDNMISFTVDVATSTPGVDKDGRALPAGISNTGSLLANGGTIMLSAKSAAGVLDNVINLEGIAQARSVYEDKGRIIISGDPDAGIVRVAANIDASGKGAGQKGGTVQITGHNILIDSPTSIDVSGDAGGGSVDIGGSYQGKGPLANANAVVMMPDAVINANAINTGNGGNVVLWADNVTKFYGNIFSQGGALSGNGGLVETSGKAYLDANGGYVNTLAANGETGTWLLDPTNIYIATNLATAQAAGMVGGDTTANTVNAGVFEASGAVEDSLLTTANLVAALGVSNVNVTTTNAAGTGSGNINVVSAFTIPTARTLTLSADNNIVTTGIISLTGTSILNLTAGTTVATGGVTLNGNIRGTVTGAGTVNINTGAAGAVTINTALGTTAAFGSLVVNAPVFINAASVTTTTSQTYNGNITPGAATTLIQTTGATGNINITQPLNWANSNTLSLAATGATGTITLPSSITTTNGGTIQLNAGPAQNLAAGGTIINVDGFNLVRGTWSQVGLVNPAFYAADFRLNSSGTPSSTTAFYRALGGDGTVATPYQLYDVYGLQGMGSGTTPLTQNYILMNNLDMTPTSSWNNGTGWAPIGTAASVATRFSGVFDGDNFTLDNLTMNKAATYTALFGYIQGGTVRNLNLTNVNITSTGNNTGAVAGQLTGSALLDNINISGSISGVGITGGAVGRSLGSTPVSVNNVHFTGTVTGTGSVTGGLVGSMQNNNTENGIANSSANAIVSGTNDVGGLLGEMQNNNADMYITNSFATGTVTGVTSVGGLVGRMQGNNSVNPFINEIINSYSTSTVSGTTNVGGLIGQMRTTNINLLGFNTITNSFSSGQVNIIGTGTNVGGLVGYMNILSVINGSYSNVAAITDTTGSTNIGGLVGSNEGEINNSYTITSVSGQATTNNLGGLVGNNAGIITNAYSIGAVNGNGSTTVGGLVGINTGTVNNSYWNTETSGLLVSAGGIGLTTAQMQNQASYTGWDFATTWNIVDGQSYPYLRAFYAAAPRSISGTTNAAGGTAVTFAANGTVVDTTYTSSNGSYYFLAGNNLISGINTTIADGAAILAYLNSGGSVGNAVTLAPTSNGGIAGFNIALNGLNIGSDNSATLNVGVLTTALGGLTGSSFLYSTAGNNLTVGNITSPNVAFNTTTNTTYNITGNIDSAAGATASSITFGGVANVAANTTLSATAINFINGLTGNSNVTVNGIGANNTLTVKTSSAPTFNITNSNAGNVTGINAFLGLLGFTNIQNLIGSDNGNTFVVANNAGVTGTINGANLNSSNILDLTALTSAVSIVLTNTNDGSITNAASNLIAAFANITTVNTNANLANTITVPAGKGNDVFVTGAGAGYINDPIYFNGVNNFIGTSNSSVNFLSGAIYNAATNTYIVNGVAMTFANFGTFSGFSTPTVQTPGTIVNVIQQPPTNAEQNNNSPSSTSTSTSPTWVLAGTTIDQNLTTIVADAANSFDNDIQKVKVNPYCFTTQ